MKKVIEFLPMRIIKSAIAIFIAQIVGPLVGGDRLFASLGALKSMRESIALSIQSLLEQSFANFLGLVFSLIYGYFFGISPVTISLAILTLFLAIKAIGFEETYMSAGLTLIAIMLLSHTEQDLLARGFNRFYSTLVGMIIALAINFLIFRPKPKIVLQDVLLSINNSVDQYLKTGLDQDAYNVIKENISDLEHEQKIIRFESKAWVRTKRQKKILAEEKSNIIVTQALLEAVFSIQTLDDELQKEMIDILSRLNYIHKHDLAENKLDELMNIKQDIKHLYLDHTDNSNFFKNTEFLSKLNIYINTLKEQ